MVYYHDSTLYHHNLLYYHIFGKLIVIYITISLENYHIIWTTMLKVFNIYTYSVTQAVYILICLWVAIRMYFNMHVTSSNIYIRWGDIWKKNNEIIIGRSTCNIICIISDFLTSHGFHMVYHPNNERLKTHLFRQFVMTGVLQLI